MYIERVPNRDSPPAILVRTSRREGDKIIKTTLANLSGLPEEIIEVVRLAIQGKKMVPADEAIKIVDSRPHGHVEAILGVMRQLELDRIISSTPGRERNLVLAMVASRLLSPCSKRATAVQWETTTLGEELGVGDATEKDLYGAMDWLINRQNRIEKKLADRHLTQEEGQGSTLVLYDISSSSYYGEHCPLVKYGHSRDDASLPQIVYGVLTNKEGCPISVDVYEGNTADSSTVTDQVEKLQKRFGLERVVLVGDRGMLTSRQIEKLKEHEGLGWVSALRSVQIRKLLDEQNLQLGLFDERNLVEIESVDFAGERLVVCRNPLLLERRRHNRATLLRKTEADLKKVCEEAERRTKTPLTDAELGDKAGRVLDKYRMRKHFKIDIAEGTLKYARDEESVRAEERMDGIYVLRTGEAATDLSAPDVVRTYKSLSQVEDAFRCLKGADLSIRPIHHHLENRVRAHVFICLLAYYVEWHMRQRLSSVLYQEDEALEAEDPVAPVQASEALKKKKSSGKTKDGWPVYRWQDLIAVLGAHCRNWCEVIAGKKPGNFVLHTERTPFQQHVFELLGLKK